MRHRLDKNIAIIHLVRIEFRSQPVFVKFGSMLCCRAVIPLSASQRHRHAVNAINTTQKHTQETFRRLATANVECSSDKPFQQLKTTNNTPQQQHRQHDVDRLERSYQEDACFDGAIKPPLRHAMVSMSSRSSKAISRPSASIKLRPLYIRHALPVLRTIRFAERRLESSVMTVASTVMLVVGVIIWDRGIESLLDGLLGDSPTGSLFCILFGLGLIVLVRLSGGKVRGFFSV